MTELVPPHGSKTLKPLLLSGDDRASELEKAAALKSIPLTTREISDVFMLGMGAYTPLDGFMGEADWRGVCEDMKLANGLFWPIPVTVSAGSDKADSITIGEDIALADGESGEILAVMNVAEKYSIDKKLECVSVYKTDDENHPGVQKVLAQETVNLGGSVKVLSEGEYPEKYADLYLTPEQSRTAFIEKGWSRAAAFQTRNPMHRSHEYLAKIAVEITDGVFIHQVLGALKPGDIPAEVRTEAIQAMIDNYFVKGTVIQAGYPIEMRYAGPREALFHALIRQNFGCSHLIIGRDHAGVGDYYGPFDAHKIFDEIPAGSLTTQALKIDITFFCKICDGMATAKTCPHGKADQISISGTQQREMLSTGAEIPKEFSRPEVVEVLRRYYNSL
ncbi:MAG: sulfate adenylyltransferase [Hyphomicrobiales bacterium]|nr:sulfate adenylyltransferase [Hyphomicrobiales bacterium]